MNFFTYGTFKRGQVRNYVLDQLDMKFISPARTLPEFKMLLCGGMYPGLLLGTDAIEGELYTTHDGVWDTLDAIEGVRSNLFERETIQLEDGSIAVTYVLTEVTVDYNKRYGGFSELPNPVSFGD